MPRPSASLLEPSVGGHGYGRALSGLQGQEKWRLIALTDLVFVLTLVHHKLSCQSETDGGPKQRHGGWASDVGAIDQKIAAVLPQRS